MHDYISIFLNDRALKCLEYVDIKLRYTMIPNNIPFYILVVGNTAFTQMQDEGFPLHLVLKYLEVILSLFMKYWTGLCQTRLLWMRPCCTEPSQDLNRQICMWDLCSSEILHSVEQKFLIYILGKPLSHFQGSKNPTSTTEVKWYNKNPTSTTEVKWYNFCFRDFVHLIF